MPHPAQQKQHFNTVSNTSTSNSREKSLASLPDLTKTSVNKATNSTFSPNFKSNGCSVLTPNLPDQPATNTYASNLGTPNRGAPKFGSSSSVMMTPASGSEKVARSIHPSSFFSAGVSNNGNITQLKHTPSPTGFGQVTAKLATNSSSNILATSPSAGIPKVGQLLSGSVMDILKGNKNGISTV